MSVSAWKEPGNPNRIPTDEMCGRTFQAEGSACAKAQRHELEWQTRNKKLCRGRAQERFIKSCAYLYFFCVVSDKSISSL